MVGDRVFLHVSLGESMMRFGKRGKHSPRFIGQFEILTWVGKVAYKTSLSLYLSSLNHIFHVSMLKWYVHDEFHLLQWDSIHLDESLSFVEEPIVILDWQIRRLQSKEILSIKVQQSQRFVVEATCEAKLDMYTWNRYLFERSGTFKDKSLFGSGCCNEPRGHFYIFVLYLYYFDPSRSFLKAYVLCWVGLNASGGGRVSFECLLPFFRLKV
ncbi:hypothetical protein MTR67_023140 [Solanum verrucosum]|uniref:Tf2-1-like SH3-like domain-containing protein n=1 Tax=Solanum verrucosum TaxID=315347 RepID=A0AAF0TXD5_SOLVR|nr:hypothetical protein MTR67_023140 [Solanum verrucosum]